MHPLVYVLPVHNEAKNLAANVARACAFLSTFPGSEVYLVENGSSDASWQISQDLDKESETRNIRVRAFREPIAGIGYGYHRGLSEALARFGPDPNVWSVLQGADLPFGFSDANAALLDLSARASGERETRARILMGSKAHPESQVGTRDATRKVMSALYRLARRAAIDMKVGDSQGSVFTRLDLAAILVPKVKTRGFFYTTELCYYAEQEGESIVELPVVLEEGRRASTVRPVRDGLAMARELLRVRRERGT